MDANHNGTSGVRANRDRGADINQDNSHILRIRIITLPALRYEGFDLSSYQVGRTYDVGRRLAELLVERGHAEPATRSHRHRADDSKK
jgi:hypothetical protein